MKLDIVKYSNWLNNITFTGFGQTDYNLFMVLCAAMKDKGTNEYTFSFTEIREKAGLEGSLSNSRMITALDSMTDKMQRVVCKIRTDTEIVKFVLFPTFRIDGENGLLTVAVNKDFQFVLNGLAGQFTMFELQEFVKLDSKYAKTLYRLLKQFRTTGDLTIKVEDFRNKLDIPKSYPKRNIKPQIIDPTIRALKESFPDLECTPLKASKRGAPVYAYRFSFTPEAPDRQRTMADWQKEKETRYVLEKPSEPEKKQKIQYVLKKPSEKKRNNTFELQREYNESEVSSLESILLGEGTEADYEKF